MFFLPLLSYKYKNPFKYKLFAYLSLTLFFHPSSTTVHMCCMYIGYSIIVFLAATMFALISRILSHLFPSTKSGLIDHFEHSIYTIELINGTRSLLKYFASGNVLNSELYLFACAFVNPNRFLWGLIDDSMLNTSFSINMMKF